jgi:hypothetical protein
MPVEYRDRGLSAVLKRIAKTNREGVRVGIVGAAADEPHFDSDLTVGEVAEIHEFGVGQEERSWCRAWVREVNFREAYQQAKGDYKKIAAALAEDCQRRIKEGRVTPGLAPSTIQKKGHDVPLLETAQLVDAISGSVVRR